LTDARQIHVIWENMGLLYASVDIFCRLSTMHERDRQTDQGTVTVTSIAD